MTCQRFHTVSRMRENCTYGSMRGSRRKTAKSVLRVVEDRADVPCGGVSPYSTPLRPQGSFVKFVLPRT